MKHMNIVVSVIIIAAVLVAAYAVGLLVRHARMHDNQSGLAATEDFKAKMGQQMPGERYPRGADGNTPAQVRQQREQMLEAMKHMTDEEKHRFTEEQVRKRFGAGKPRVHEMSPKQRAETVRQQVVPEDANQAPKAQKGEPQTTAGQQPQTTPNPGNTATPQKPEQTPGQGGSEPKKAGQG
jgi:hypothetical protein